MIAREGMLPGTKLPDEESLSLALNVSAITTRRALKELSSLGIVEREQGRGTFVRKEIAEKKLAGTLGIWLISDSKPTSNDIAINGSLIAQIQDECGKYGYGLKAVSLGRGSYGIANEELPGLSGVFITGVVNDDWIAYLKGIGMPFVVLGESIAETSVPRIGYDWKAAADMLVSELTLKGAEKIAFLNGAKTYPPSRKCYEGYQEALAKRGLPFNDSWVTWCLQTEYLEKIREFFVRHKNIEFDAVIIEEGVYPHFMSYLYDVDLFHNRRIPIGILGNNRGSFQGKHLINVGFSNLIIKYSVKELLRRLTGGENKNKTILLKPHFIKKQRGKHLEK